MKIQQQMIQHNLAGAMPLFAYWQRVRPLVFVFFVLLASALAFPALFMALFLWHGFDMERDYNEYRRIVWTMAIMSLLLYIIWVLLVVPSPKIFIMLWESVVYRLWQNAAIALGWLWLVNMMLTPLFVLLLSFFVPSAMREAYNGWKRDSQAMIEHLIQQVDLASDLFCYAGIGLMAVSLAIKALGGLLYDSDEFLEWLDKQWLELEYAHNAQARSEIRDMAASISDAQLMYAHLFCRLARGLNGIGAVDDVDYASTERDGVDSRSPRKEVAVFECYILDDAKNYAMGRKNPNEQVFFMIDREQRSQAIFSLRKKAEQKEK
jgi:hypothetical protein